MAWRQGPPAGGKVAVRLGSLYDLIVALLKYIAKAAKQWLKSSGVQALYIEPGSPRVNAYSETFASRFGDELL